MNNVRYNITKEIITSIKNEVKPLPKKADVLQHLQLEIANVIRFSLSNWQNAYEDAIDHLRYDREDLLDIYEQIEIDDHVSALIDTIYNNIIACEFLICDKQGENIPDAHMLFKRPWFYQWIAMALDAIYHGFNGMQFTGTENGSYADVKLIPREHILPYCNGIRYNDNSYYPDILFDDRLIRNWTCMVFPQLPGDQYQLGKFNKIAKLFILKRENMQFWAMFNEIFGIPFRVLKTDLKDKTRMQNAISAMETMTAAAYSVIHDEDEIVFHNGVASSNTDTFKEFINHINKGMSKTLIGSTMVLEDGSSRSQSEVHERNTEAFILSYKRTLAEWINRYIIPKMNALGMAVPQDAYFKWDDTEVLSKMETVELIARLNAAGYKVPLDYVVEKTGIPVEEGESVPFGFQGLQNTSQSKKVNSMYGLRGKIKKFFNRR